MLRPDPLSHQRQDARITPNADLPVEEQVVADQYE